MNRAWRGRESGAHGAEAGPRHGVDRHVPSDDHGTSEVETLFGQGSSSTVASQAPGAGGFAPATRAPRLPEHASPSPSNAGRLRCGACTESHRPKLAPAKSGHIVRLPPRANGWVHGGTRTQAKDERTRRTISTPERVERAKRAVRGPWPTPGANAPSAVDVDSEPKRNGRTVKRLVRSPRDK